MSAFLFILGGLAFLIGTANILHATSAHHENGAYLLWVIFAVFISGGAVVNAVNSAVNSLQASFKRSISLLMEQGGAVVKAINVLQEEIKPPK